MGRIPPPEPGKDTDSQRRLAPLPRLEAHEPFASDLTTPWLVGEIETGEDRATLLTEPIIDPADDVRSHDAAKADTWRHPVVLETHILVAVEDLSRIQERGHFKIRGHARNLGPGNMDTLLDTRCDQMLVNEPVHAVSAEIVLTPQGALLEERHICAERGLQVGPDDQNGALGFAGKEV